MRTRLGCGRESVHGTTFQTSFGFAAPFGVHGEFHCVDDLRGRNALRRLPVCGVDGAVGDGAPAVFRQTVDADVAHVQVRAGVVVFDVQIAASDGDVVVELDADTGVDTVGRTFALS